jgi:SAM-dependent methyltransferase
VDRDTEERKEHMKNTGTQISGKCIVCGIGEVVRLFALPALDGPYRSDQLSPVMRTFFRCRECGFAFARPFDESRYENYYSSLNGDYHRKHDVDVSRYRAVLDALSLTRGTRVLDWGCGEGTFLSLLPESVERCGFEMCEPAAKIARQRGIRVVSERDLSQKGMQGYFDVITAIDVAEHVGDLNALKDRIARALRPGGTFVVLTGNLDSQAARSLGRHWDYLHYAEHVSFLTDRAARIWLESNFDDIQIRPISHHNIAWHQFIRAGFVFPITWTLERANLALHFRKSAKLPANLDHMLVVGRRKQCGHNHAPTA